MKGTKRWLVLAAFCALLCLPVTLYGDTNTRGIMGMWVNTFTLEGCDYDSSLNRTKNDDFYHDLRDELETHPYYEQQTQYSESNVFTTRILEDWRDWRYSGQSWQDGYDKNDDPERMLLIISTHGGISHEHYGRDPKWWFRTMVADDDREVDSTDTMSSTFKKCHLWWRNRNNWSRALVRMGSSGGSSNVGNGSTRWIILHTCRNLQLTDPDEDHEDYSVQDLWGSSALNGGYRMLIGGSGHMQSDVEDASEVFVEYQYDSNFTHKQAWFSAMADEFDDYQNGTPDEGRCVVYAKGGSSIHARSVRDYDDFKMLSVPAVTSSTQYSAWSSQNCED